MRDQTDLGAFKDICIFHQRDAGEVLIDAENIRDGIVRKLQADFVAIHLNGIGEAVFTTAARAAEGAAASRRATKTTTTAETAATAAAAKVPMETELNRAAKLYAEAKALQQKAFDDIKAGRPLALEPMQNMASAFMESVFRNQDALLCMSRIREKDAYLLEHSVNVSILMTILAACDTTVSRS